MRTFNVMLTLAAIFAVSASAQDKDATTSASTTSENNITTTTVTEKDSDSKDSGSDSDSDSDGGDVERLREIVEALCSAAEDTSELIDDFNNEGGRRLSRKLDGHSDDEKENNTWVCDEATGILKELEEHDEADEDGKDEIEEGWGNDLQDLIEELFEGASTSFAVASAMAASVTLLSF